MDEFESSYLDNLERLLDAPMKWVGMYVAAASAICTLAMAADVFHGLRKKRFWFPCKYFSLNATFLTLLAVAMKPPIDLSDDLHKDAMYYIKVSSVTFMSTVVVNLMSSLGSMNDQSLLTNTIALAILVVTIVGNMWIQVIQLEPYLGFLYDLADPTIWLLVLLVTLVSSAITVPNIKRTLELKYQEIHKVALSEEHALKCNEKFTIANQMEKMKKYMVMAETSNPQFVMARTVVSSTSSGICLLATFTFRVTYLGPATVWIPIRGMWPLSRGTTSAYGWSAYWIIAIQSIGIVIGLVAPTLRLFNNIRAKCSTISYKSIREECTIENYWTQTLVDWRDNSLALQIRHNMHRKCFHGTKWLIMNICIGVQILVVLLSKILVFLCVLLMTPFIVCFTRVRKFFANISALLRTHLVQRSSKDINSNNHAGIELGENIELNLNRYVLLLEGESEIPETSLKRIFQQANKVIQTGKKRQPENLTNFLQKSGNFHGVREFDSVQVSSLHAQEPSNCWTLPLMTLTSIAIALPNVTNHKAEELLSIVREGMSLAKLIDEASDTNGELANLIKAADVAWTGVVLYKKWQDIDLQKTSFTGKNSMAILQKLSNKGESIVRKFTSEAKDLFMENPLNWPVKVIAGNSMYRICETILLSITGENDLTEEELFKKLSVMIVDVLAACFTNLPHVINTMCHQSAIEKREKSVREAFLLLGKTEGILELLQQREWPSFDPVYKMLYLDEWRAYFQQDDENPGSFTSTSSNETLTTPFIH